MGDAELDGMARALAEAFAAEAVRLREQTAGQIADLTQIVQAAQATLTAAVARTDALTAQVAAQSQLIEVLRAENADFARVHDQLAGEVAAQNMSAQEVQREVRLLDSRSQAAGEVAGHANAEAAALRRAAPDALSVDGSRLVLRCADGRELSAQLPPPPDTAAIALLVVEKHLDVLRGDKGDKGDEGPAPVLDLAELAAVVRAAPEFVEAARGLKGDKGDKGDRGEQGLPDAPAEPWAAGVHRQGVRRSHHLGRVYEATADTTDEPGDSPHWRRLDTTGLRHIGASDAREPGDIHVKDGATFLYDGVRSKLLFGKACTASEVERLLGPVKDGARQLGERIAATDARTTKVFDLARSAKTEAAAAKSSADEAWGWIVARAEAIDALLGGGAP